MATVNYATNTSQRTPCILLLDASYSMNTKIDSGGTRISHLNDGIQTFHQELQEDEIALSRVQVAAITVGGVGSENEAQLLMDWTDAIDFQPFELRAQGTTPLGAGTLLALGAIASHKANLGSHGLSYTRPWMFILTDGDPTDPHEIWAQACAEAREAESSDKVMIYPIGVSGSDYKKLSEISRTPPMMMDAVRFRELFVWISASLGTISRSAPGETVELSPTNPWAAVKL